MTGKILRIEKHAGDAVEEDEAVLIMEAVKMEIPVVSPIDGVVANVKVSEGDTVSAGQPLADVE
jgi:biotin carboxyl carrier protein